MTLPNYDSWLTRPYEEMYEENDQFNDFCNREGFLPDDPRAWDEYEAWIDEQRELSAEYQIQRYEEDW